MLLDGVRRAVPALKYGRMVSAVVRMVIGVELWHGPPPGLHDPERAVQGGKIRRKKSCRIRSGNGYPAPLSRTGCRWECRVPVCRVPGEEDLPRIRMLPFPPRISGLFQTQIPKRTQIAAMSRPRKRKRERVMRYRPGLPAAVAIPEMICQNILVSGLFQESFEFFEPVG